MKSEAFSSSVRVEQVSKSFNGTQVLRDINLEVQQGDFVTLLGPSGCGKTTLLRIIAGLERPDTGLVQSGDNVFVDMDKGVVADPQDRKLGFVFQDYGLWPHLTVAENVAFPLKMSKTPSFEIAKRVKDVLSNVQLETHAEKLPEQLSGGQKQRVSIARALAGHPRLILFDEPLSNLDANLREELGQEIRMLSKRLGLTCINVTHDRREAQILSDYVALMKHGVFHQFGRPEDLFRQPKDKWAAEFLDAGNILPAKGLVEGCEEPHHHVLVPRGSLYLSDTGSGLEANVLNCIYIDDRYEMTVELEGETAKLYSECHVDINATVFLSVKQDEMTLLTL